MKLKSMKRKPTYPEQAYKRERARDRKALRQRTREINKETGFAPEQSTQIMLNSPQNSTEDSKKVSKKNKKKRRVKRKSPGACRKSPKPKESKPEPIGDSNVSDKC